MTILTSYLSVNQIAFSCPCQVFHTMQRLETHIQHNGHHVWTFYASKDFRNSKKCLITFITSNHIFLCKMNISISKGLKISSSLKSYNNSTSMFIVIKIIVVLMHLTRTKWTLYWFITHVDKNSTKKWLL